MVQSRMPKNIYNFTNRYLNNSLATRNNLAKWNIAQSSDCSFCQLPETLLHVVAGCKSYLEEGRYTWRHNSALQILAEYFKTIPESSLYADLSGFLSPSLIPGAALRPDLLLLTTNNRRFILELTVGSERVFGLQMSMLKEALVRLTLGFRLFCHGISCRSFTLVCRMAFIHCTPRSSNLSDCVI